MTLEKYRWEGLKTKWGNSCWWRISFRNDERNEGACLSSFTQPFEFLGIRALFCTLQFSFFTVSVFASSSRAKTQLLSLFFCYQPFNTLYSIVQLVNIPYPFFYLVYSNFKFCRLSNFLDEHLSRFFV